jgi:hypothetical protein
MAETKKDALAAFDAFIEIWGVKYDKAVECLIKDRDALLTFYDFPAEHWKHQRTSGWSDAARWLPYGVQRRRCRGHPTADRQVHAIRRAYSAWLAAHPLPRPLGARDSNRGRGSGAADGRARLERYADRSARRLQPQSRAKQSARGKMPYPCQRPPMRYATQKHSCRV